jgi:hypothetical protein
VATRRSAWLLFLGAATGLGLATFGLLEDRPGPRELGSQTAAQVGERTIRRVDYERVLAGVEGDLRNPIDDSTRRRVLDRMVDEELLVQRALELGLASIDRRVRGELTAGLMDSIVGEADANGASSKEVERHYKENVDFFARPGRIHARTIYFSSRRDGREPSGDAASRAERAATRIRNGEDASEVEEQLGDRQVSPLPGGLLPPSKIRDYVGPIILQSLRELTVGQWSEPIESGGGVYLALVVARDAPIRPPFEDVEGLVRQDLKRRRGDEALRVYLDDLRDQIPVRLNESVFSASK